MGNSAGRGLGDHGGKARAAALGDHDAVGAGALGGTDDGAQVMGVGDLVAHHDQGLFILLRGFGKDVLHAHILPHGGKGDDALMGVGAAHAVQLALVGVHHHDARGTGFGGDVAQGFIRLTLLDEDLVDILTGPQSFDDGVAALDYAVGLSGQGIFLFFVHIGFSLESFSHTDNCIVP